MTPCQRDDRLDADETLWGQEAHDDCVTFWNVNFNVGGSLVQHDGKWEVRNMLIKPMSDSH